MQRPSASAWWIGIPLGFALLVLLLLVVADLFDRQLLADPLQAMVEERIGRELRLEDVDLRWGLPMSLHMGQFTLANAAWASDTPMLRASPASISLSPLALLDGPPYARLELGSPRIVVARSEQGQWNWQLETGPPSEPEEAPSLPVTLAAEGGSIIVRNGQTLRIDLHKLSVSTADDAHSVALDLEASTGGMPLVLDGRVDLAASRYSGDAAIRVGESHLSAEFAVDTGATPVAVQAQIDAEALVPSQLASLMPADDTHKDDGHEQEQTMPLPRLGGFAADIAASIETLRLPAVTVTAAHADFDLHNGLMQFVLDRARIGDAAVTGEARLDTMAEEPALRVEADLERTALSELPADLPFASRPGEIAASVAARLEMPERRLPLTAAAALSRLAVPESRFLYARQEGEKVAEMILNLQVMPAGGEPSIELDLRGVEAPPFEAALSAPPLRQLSPPALRYPVELIISTDGAEATVAADLGELLREPGFAVEFSISGNKLPSLPAFGFTPPPVPRFAASGSLQHERQQWELTDAEISWGESRITGSATYELARQGSDRPMISVDAHASRLNLPRLLPNEESATEAEPDPAESGQRMALAKALRAVNADVAFSAGRVQLTEEQAIRDAAIDAELRNGHLEMQTLAFDFASGHVEGALALEAAGSSVEGQLVLNADELQPAAVSDALLPLQEEFGRVSGELHLSISEEPPASAAGSVLLPTLGRLSIDGTRLRLRNEDAATDVTLRLSTEGLQQANQEQQLHVEGTGRYRGEPLSIDLRGGPLAALRKPQEPYDLDLELRVGGVEATLEGQVEQPWSPRSAQLQFSASAEQPRLIEQWLAPWYDVSLPTFEADGQLRYSSDRSSLSISEFDADFGQSDLYGSLSLDWSASTPSITASLRSEQMQLDDLRAVTRKDESSPGPPGADVLPDEKFDLGMLEKASADIQYEAADLDAGDVALGSVSARINLEDGHLVAQPVIFEAAGGEIDFRLDMQATESALEGVIDVEMRGINLARLLQQESSASTTFGVVGGQGKFWLRGDSVAALAASTDGGLLFLMTGGTLNALLVELASLDIGEALLAAVGLADPVAVDCGYASLHSTAGIVDVYRFVVDTKATTFFLNGEINLRNETLDLTLYPQSKDAGFPAAEAAIVISGPLQEPQVDLQEEDLAGLALGALALGAIAGPAGALLPLVEAGLQDEPSLCGGWVERLKRRRDDES